MSEDSLLTQYLDEYQVLSVLGRGGMARVYRGIDTRLKRYVAIKVIDKPYRNDPDYTRRFEMEAQTIARLQHPNVVQLYRYGEAQGFLYMVMQYVDGTDLAQLLQSYRQQGRFMEPQNILSIMREVCAALDYVHTQGVIHRDIKPSNIMMDRQGHAILADFGLSLLTDVGTRGEVFGTPEYIAPEQAISSANAQPASDLYAMGVILYEIFTGQLPFYAPDPLDMAMLHLSEAPPAPSLARPDISPAVEAVMLKTLAKQPEGRYPSGAALVTALEQALYNVPEGPSSVAEQVQAHSVMLPPPQQVLLQLRAQPPKAAMPPPSPAQRMLATQQVTAEVTIPPTEITSPPDRPLPPLPHKPIEAPLPRTEVAVPPPSTGAPSLSPTFVPNFLLSGRAWVILAGMAGLLFLAGIGCLVGILVLNFLTANDHAVQITQASAAASPVPAGAVKATSRSTSSPDSALSTATHTAAKGSTFNLIILARSDGLFVFNDGPNAFLLGPLQIGSASNQVGGAEWNVRTLDKGQCVSITTEKKKPKLPKGYTCSQVSSLSIQDKSLWEKPIEVYYNSELIITCPVSDQPCEFKITTP